MEHTDLRREIPGNAAYCLRVLGGFVHHDDRRPFVAANSDPRVDRNLTQERNVEFLRSPASTPGVENILSLSAMAANKEAHILHDSKNRDVHFVEHYKPFPRISQRNILRRRHNNRSG